MPRVASRPREPSLIVPVDTLEPAPIDIIKPIHIVVRPDDDEFIATFFDANISASGETQEEAFSNVKDLVVMQFTHLEKMPSEKLGAARRRQQSVLLSMLKRRA